MIGSNEAARLYISVGADVRSAMTNLAQVDRRVERTASVVQRTNPILQGLGQGLGLAAIGSAALATKAVTDLAFASIDAASDLREAVTLSDQVFESNSAAMQAWAGGVADTFGQSQREALNYASGFGTAFKNVGMDLDDVGAKSQALTRLAADLGSAFNRGSDEAATALRAGLIGETEPMRRFGVFLSEAAVQAKALQMGIADAGEELSDTQKVAARYAIIMEQTADSQGMFGRDSESLADTQKALAAEMENLAAKAGQMVLPAMVDLTTFLNTEGVPALENEIEGVKALADELAGLADQAREPVGGGLDIAQQMGDNIVMLGDFLTFWDGFVTEYEMGQRRLAEEQARGMADLSNFAGKAEDDLAIIPPALDDVASAGASMASSLVRSNSLAIASFDDMRSRMSAAASGAADAVYGPLIAKTQLAATEREIATQREIIAHGRSTAAAGASSSSQVDAIGRQIAALEELERVQDRAFAKSMAGYSEQIAAQLGLLDADERARHNADRDADLAERIAAAQGDVGAATDPAERMAAEARLGDLLEQQNENRLSDDAAARREELRATQKAIDAIVDHERDATDERKALVEARANAAAIASDIAAAREIGDLQRVADLGLVLEAQRAEIAHLASQARQQDRLDDLEQEKEFLERRRGAVAASGAAEVEDAKARLAQLQATRIEQLALLASYGDQAAADTLMFSQEMQDAMINGTDEVKARLLELRHELWLLRMDLLETAGLLDFSDPFGPNADHVSGPGFSGTRAAGGPVRKGLPYLVGEEGPEAFVPWASGSIVPNDASLDPYVPAMAATVGESGWSGGGGSATFTLNVNVTSPLVFDPYGAAAQQLAESLTPAMDRALARAGA